MKTSGLIPNSRKGDLVLENLVLWAALAVIILTVAFAGYYYWDRYIHIGDQSPLERGVGSLEEAVRANPQDPEARLALAQYYLDNGAFDEAASQAQQVLRAFPDNEGALFVQGISHFHSGEIETAVPPLTQFIEIRRQSPMAGTDTALETALYFLGASHNSLSQPALAIPALTEALAINSTDADAMYQLGLAYAQDGQHAAAIEQYQNAIRFVPDFVEVYENMTTSYEALGQPEQANYARGMAAFSNHDFAKAQGYLESVTAVQPDFAPAFLGLGLVYEKLGDLPAAQTSLQRALELDPESFLANHSLGRVQQSLSGQ